MDASVAGVVGDEFGVGVGPGGRVVAGEAAVAAGPPDGARLGGLEVGVEYPVVTDAHQHLRTDVREPGAQGDGVIAGVEHEHGHLAVAVVGVEERDEVTHLGDGGVGGVGGRGDAAGVQRRGPRVGGPVQL
ncbi:MAG: hypothetical protein ACRDU8_02155, partial [Egibacteraceae bacterium]